MLTVSIVFNRYKKQAKTSNIVKVKLEGTNDIASDPQNKISKRKHKQTPRSLKKKKSKKTTKSSIASEDSADDTISLNGNDHDEQNASETVAMPHSKLLGDRVGSCDSETRLPEHDCQLTVDASAQSRFDEVESTQNDGDEKAMLSLCKVDGTRIECGDDLQRISEACRDEKLQKYWYQRYRLFSRFDKGIKIDRGAFYFILSF